MGNRKKRKVKCFSPVVPVSQTLLPVSTSAPNGAFRNPAAGSVSGDIVERVHNRAEQGRFMPPHSAVNGYNTSTLLYEEASTQDTSHKRSVQRNGQPNVRREKPYHNLKSHNYHQRYTTGVHRFENGADNADGNKRDVSKASTDTTEPDRDRCPPHQTPNKYMKWKYGRIWQFDIAARNTKKYLEKHIEGENFLRLAEMPQDLRRMPPDQMDIWTRTGTVVSPCAEMRMLYETTGQFF